MCYNHLVLPLALYVFLCGFALFLLGLSVFMYFEGRKFGDNQFTMKLLPPPAKRDSETFPAALSAEEGAFTGPRASLSAGARR